MIRIGGATNDTSDGDHRSILPDGCRGLSHVTTLTGGFLIPVERKDQAVAPRLTKAEIAAARSDLRYQVRPRRTDPDVPPKMVTDSERAIAALLDELGVEYEYEDRFFPTYVDDSGVEYGFCPDFRLLETSEWPEQFIEVTEGKNSCLGPKRRKIAMASAIYGIQICLVERVAYAAVMAAPESLLDLLVTYDRTELTAVAAPAA